MPAAADLANPIEAGAVSVRDPAPIEANLATGESRVTVALPHVAADRSPGLRAHSAGKEQEQQEGASNHGSCTAQRSLPPAAVVSTRSSMPVA